MLTIHFFCSTVSLHLQGSSEAMWAQACGEGMADKLMRPRQTTAYRLLNHACGEGMADKLTDETKASSLMHAQRTRLEAVSAESRC